MTTYAEKRSTEKGLKAFFWVILIVAVIAMGSFLLNKRQDVNSASQNGDTSMQQQNAYTTPAPETRSSDVPTSTGTPPASASDSVSQPAGAAPAHR